MLEEATVTKPARKPKAELATQQQQIQVINSPDNLIAMAIDKDLDIEKLERLIALKERNDAKIAYMQYIEAFGKFQSICPPLVKNKKVSFDHRDGGGKTEYKYQELPDIEKHIKPYLAECGLSYKWNTKEDGNKIWVQCIILHTGGHIEVGDPISGEPDNSGKKNTIQQKSSTTSYLRRGTLTGILGLSSADPDNDGAGGKPDENMKNLPRLKDTQLSGAIKSIMEVTRTVDMFKKHVILSAGQESALMKAEEEAKKSPDYESKLKTLKESIENQNTPKP